MMIKHNDGNNNNVNDYHSNDDNEDDEEKDYSYDQTFLQYNKTIENTCMQTQGGTTGSLQQLCSLEISVFRLP